MANVGDSRAILYTEEIAETFKLSSDHKPGKEDEEKRIKANGGSVY